MSLNGLLDLIELQPFQKITADVQDEVLEKAGRSNQNKAVNMEPNASADGELLLTNYLLNFGEEESSRDGGDGGYFDGNCSGLECTSDSENYTLASLKKSLKKNKKSSGATGKFPKKKDKKRGKGVDSNDDSKIVGRHKANGRPILDPVYKKERDRMRSVNYRLKRTEKITRLEKESIELTESNNTLSDKNRALNERVLALENQVEYLENVLANESALSTILNKLAGHPGLEFKKNALHVNSLKRKRQDSDCIQDENEMTAKKNNCSPSTKPGGVCLHLTSGRVSLEFCRECHKSSTNDENN